MSAEVVLIVILVYFIILLSISYITSRKSDNQSFFLGDRKSPWYIVAFGMIGASLSGVTYISVPGWVGESQFTYMQMVFGYLIGYYVIANVLMPLYYKLNLTSIYTYLEDRFGFWSYKTGVFFFLISRTFGAAARLFIVANVLQITVFEHWGVHFIVTVLITILLIWLYTYRGGIKTIIWTDTLQTFFMLLAVAMTVILISKELDLSFYGLIGRISESKYANIFVFEEWSKNGNYFVKHFLGGAFIAIAMTGLDQDMMQKNLSCKNIRDAKKNMLWFSLLLVPVNLLFLSLGALLYIYAVKLGIPIPESSDDLFPNIATGGYLGSTVSLFFILGLIAAAYSSADSALTSLTTSFTVDILGIRSKNKGIGLRKKIHLMFSVILLLVIMGFRLLNDKSVIAAIFIVAGYTYGPLLGIYAFGLFSKFSLKDKYVPIVAIISPILCYFLSKYSLNFFKYVFGFELLILNGALTYFGLYLIRKNK